jgi:hypothetical protein
VLPNEALTHIYRGRCEERKGQSCRVLLRGNKNRCLVEFLDGFRLMTSRNTLRVVKVPRPSNGRLTPNARSFPGENRARRGGSTIGGPEPAHFQPGRYFSIRS